MVLKCGREFILQSAEFWFPCGNQAGMDKVIYDVAFCTSECSGQGEVSTWLQAAEDRMLQSFGKKILIPQTSFAILSFHSHRKGNPSSAFLLPPCSVQQEHKWQNLTLAAVVFHLSTLYSLAWWGQALLMPTHMPFHSAILLQQHIALRLFWVLSIKSLPKIFYPPLRR